MSLYRLLRRCVTEFIEDDCPQKAAAIAYYTAFSLPPIFVLLIVCVGAVADPDDVRREIASQIRNLLGSDAAEQVNSILARLEQPDGSGGIGSLVGFAALLFGATGAMAELQAALNAVWQVAPDPARGGLRRFLIKRLLSFAMLTGIGFLLLVSLIVNAALAVSAAYVDRLVSGGGGRMLLSAANIAASFAVITLLFAGIFKVLPDARIAWRHVWLGAAVTSAMFGVGKYVIGLYLGNAVVGGAYGPAGTLVVVLAWIYYSAMIVLFGAEFTQVWTHRYELRVPPQSGAVRTTHEVVQISAADGRGSSA